MSRCAVVPLVCFGLLMTAGQVAHAQGHHRLGVGAHYWTVVEDIDVDEVDENGMSYLVSYQLAPAALAKLEIALEVFPENFGGAAETVLAPEAILILGAAIYGGLGIGALYSDGEFADDPFYILRAGIDLELLPSIHIDINANYYFTDFESIKTVDETVDTDTITLGAFLRFAF